MKVVPSWVSKWCNKVMVVDVYGSKQTERRKMNFGVGLV
jgi:hypothetical protein